MSMRILDSSPVIVTVSALFLKEDLLENTVIEAVSRVYFPTMENLAACLAAIKKEDPGAQIKLYRQSHITSRVTVAKTATFAIGTEVAKLMAYEALFPEEMPLSVASQDDTPSPAPADLAASSASAPAALAASSAPDLSTDFDFCPVLVGVSEPVQKLDGLKNPLIESAVRVVLPTERNWMAALTLFRQQAPTMEIQEHFRSNRNNVLDLADFLASATAAQKTKERGTPLSASRTSPAPSLLSALQDSHFT